MDGGRETGAHVRAGTDEPGPRRSAPGRIDASLSVVLVLAGWIGAAAVLGLGLFTMMFLDDCNEPACDVPGGVHSFYLGAAVTVVVAYAAAWLTYRRPRRRRWPLALLTLVVSVAAASVTMVGVYRALALHPDEFQQQQLR